MTKLLLSEKSVLLTGASQGIGKALAFTLARAGACVGLMARKAEDLALVASQIAAQGGRSLPIAVDVARPEMIGAAVSQARVALGDIDILINAAGMQAPIGPFWENDLGQWEHNMRVNLSGPAHLIKAVLPGMMARRQGKIINFSGGGATGPRPNFSAYAAAKAALVRLTETLALELQAFNIQVNAVAPGAINTQMLEEIIAAGEKAGGEFGQALERAKTGGTPMEPICELVLFLASSASGSLTGKLISAPHDPWRQWGDKVEGLNSTPLYTLRRLDPFTIKSLIKDLS
jgi:3-oxoacyl-[acyl-carrier protein] reductase